MYIIYGILCACVFCCIYEYSYFFGGIELEVKGLIGKREVLRKIRDIFIFGKY